ncbi:serine/threonine protein kinase [Nostoc favosum]|uniref:Serine/threonine protein kinase n=1 Tax=Nostoc favosum CHAB5714 TaxID=2780399 RepID=A0ABS8I2L2_9NOSO|nr:serine/threonine-protein kinase [Nostoc favosum]MCC5598413.1 serine/threonine protein kinase [Nostoc favosum CHAB5714]
MPWIAGERLQAGKYVIEKVLGQGGFGITYKALHIELNKTVVIKTPNEYLSHDPDYNKYVERFIQEGRTLARLSEDPHPHIVGVIDFFIEGAIHCLVMDFVPGENLFEALRRRGALPEVEIVPCIRQIGEALVVVHQAGLVHRDAHPGNIMLGSNGKAVLIDFGIAKELVPKTLSSTGNAGNHGFAPYEQMTRGSREPTVDVYCLAATLYYGVTGQSPTTSLARKLENTSLTPPRQINSGISERLNQAILKGMALEAKDRPQSMQVWLAMLEAPKVTPPPLSYKALKLIRRYVYRKKVVRPKTNLNLKANPGKAATKSPKIIAWGCLTFVLLSYLLIGYLLAASNASYILWAWAVAWACVWAVAWAGAWAVAWAVTWIWACAWVGAWAGAWVLAGAVAWAIAIAGNELRKSFSKVHTFLILASTSSLGLGLGWLGHRIFNTGS